MADYPGAIDHNVPRSFMFNSNAHAAIVIHKTGGDATPEAIYNTFIASGNSVHYGVGTDGTIWQYVPESLGAGGNCCVEVGYDSFWQPYLSQYGNLNLCTLSIEHCDGSLTNSTPLTSAQQEASFKLVLYLANKYHIAPDHIKPHSSLDPISRAHCPGAYPFTDLINYVQNGGGSMTPVGWHDDGTTLTAPNGVGVRLGFRDYVLSHNWDFMNWPLAIEQGVTLLEASNPGLGGGDQQVFRWAMLGYTQLRGVFVEWLGVELATVRQQAITYHDLSKQLQAEVDSLKQQLATTQQPTGIDPTTVKDRLTAIGLAADTIHLLVTQPL